MTSICFACVCKDEEKCILTALKSVANFISYWVIIDTGSTDSTCEIIETFFKEKGIQGELHHDTWKNFGYNKTILFDKCYKKADYILHFDADDYFVGTPEFEKGKTQYYINVRKLNTIYPCLLLFDAKYHWKFCGVAHTTIKCLDCPTFTTGYLTDRDYFMYSTPDTGARNIDPEKYHKDAKALKQQFFDTLFEDPDNLNTRSIFYTAQSYRDYNNLQEAVKWYTLYTKIKNTWNEELYYAFMQLGMLYIQLNKSPEQMYISAINTINDRAEAYLLLGTWYNQNKKHQLAYDNLIKARAISFKVVQSKYILFLNEHSYSKFVNDELSVACYWLGLYNDGMELLEAIIDDPDFEFVKPRLLQNKIFFQEKMGTEIKNESKFIFTLNQ